jgi:uncharacterized membrane protein YozB (DUF420 family)
MATVAPPIGGVDTPARGYRADQAFFTRFAMVLALIIVFGFAQFALRGFVNLGAAPVRAHFHGAVMLAWLALFVVQNRLVETGNIAAHRSLGRIGAGLALLVAGTASYVGYAATLYNTRPPFFEPAYFLALTQLGALFFLFLVGWAVIRRRETQWHRRLMFASLIAILEPAFGRLLPMPLIMPYGEGVVLVVQLVAFAVLMRHDRKILGAVHPATWAGALVVTVYHLAIEILGRVGPFVSMAEQMARGG